MSQPLQDAAANHVTFMVVFYWEKLSVFYFVVTGNQHSEQSVCVLLVPDDVTWGVCTTFVGEAADALFALDVPQSHRLVM